MAESSNQILAADLWVEVAVLGAREISQTMGLGNCRVVTRHAQIVPGSPGARISLAGPGIEVEIFVSAAPQDLASIAARVLKVKPGTVLGRGDQEDALCELSNILSGRMKAGMRRVVRGMRITLPSFQKARHVEPPVACLELCLGESSMKVRVSPSAA